MSVDDHGITTDRGKIVLVASDLDGTLLAPPGAKTPRPGDGGGRSETVARMGGLTARTHSVLDRMRGEGIDLVAVTGRPPRWVVDLGLGPGLAICSNGALVLDLASGDIVTEHMLDSGRAAEIVARLRSLHPDGMMAIEFADGVGMEPAWHERVPRGAAQSVGRAEELVAQPSAKILLKVPGTEGDAYIDAATEAVGDLGEVTASGGLQLVEVSARGVTKATTLAALCDERAISSEQVVAFGDARNDLAMLDWAGVGVAMADAHPSVIDAADEVTGTNSEDGVAAWIERHLLP